MTVLYACPRCAVSVDATDRFCGGCGLQRPTRPVPAPTRVFAPPAPLLAAAGAPVAPRVAPTPPPRFEPPRPVHEAPTVRPTGQVGSDAAGSSASADRTVDVEPPPAAGRRGAGNVVLSGIGLTFRLVNGLLTVISGIAIAILAHSDRSMPHAGWVLTGGIVWALYGGYILLTRRSYWVSGWFTYLVPIAAIVYLTAGSR